MPPPRSSLLPQRTEYFCSCCIAKLRGQVLTRPQRWIRTFTVQAAHQSNLDQAPKSKARKQLEDWESFSEDLIYTQTDTGAGKPKNGQKQAKSRKRRFDGPGNSKRSESQNDAETATKTVVRHFIQNEKGELVPEQSAADDTIIEKMQKQMADIQRKLTAEPEEHDDSAEILDLPSDGQEPQMASPQRLNELQLAIGDIYIPPASESIRRLNDALLAVALGPHSKSRQQVWRYYSQSRKRLSERWDDIPRGCWDLIWRSVAEEAAENPSRTSHVLAIGNDMTSAGLGLDDMQLRQYIEAKYFTGDKEGALQLWKTSEHQLSFDRLSESRYWADGAKMLANSNKVAEAVQAATRHFDIAEDEFDGTILVPIVASYAHLQQIQQAWATYLRLSYHLRENMTMEIYDTCIAIFLKSQRPDLAVAVFGDMMLYGDLELHSMRAKANSIVVFQRVMGMHLDFDSLEASAAELDWDLQSPPIVLPRKFRNKFFYHSMIKKILGDGNTEWAADLAYLMAERGIPPDAKVCNGIIGSWMRSKKQSSFDRAENLAWQMIGTRVGFVKARSAKSLPGAPLRLVPSNNATGIMNPNPLANVRATPETFSLLAEVYQSKRNAQRIQDLCEIIRPAALKPSVGFMNSLLQYGSQCDRRRWSWSTYLQFTTLEGTIPNFDTFSILWDIAKKNWNPIETTGSHGHRSGFPSPRTLFAEMTKWKSSLKGAAMPRDMYDRIILCHGLRDDQIATGIALRGMQLFFDMYPDEQTVRSIVLQLAKVGQTNPAGFRTRRLDKSPRTQAKIARVAEVLQRFRIERGRALELTGKSFIDLEGAERGEQLILILSDVLHFVVVERAKGAAAEPDAVEIPTFRALAQEAAVEMGVHGYEVHTP